jgi:ribose transport system substrate-binding protein
VPERGAGGRVRPGRHLGLPGHVRAPIGGYAFGATAAEFIAEKAARAARCWRCASCPGVDVLENRWSGGKAVLDKAGVKVVGVEFTDGDPAKTKTIVGDYLQRFGKLDGVWADAGATAVATAEAFQDAGKRCRRWTPRTSRTSWRSGRRTS